MIEENLDQIEGQPEPNSAGVTGGGAVMGAPSYSPVFAFLAPTGIFERWRAKRCTHVWAKLTTTSSYCRDCKTDRKQLGVISIRDENGDETGEVELSEQVIRWHLLEYSKDGWVIKAGAP